jgi:hypothetical protein
MIDCFDWTLDIMVQNKNSLSKTEGKGEEECAEETNSLHAFTAHQAELREYRVRKKGERHN